MFLDSGRKPHSHYWLRNLKQNKWRKLEGRGHSSNLKEVCLVSKQGSYKYRTAFVSHITEQETLRFKFKSN